MRTYNKQFIKIVSAITLAGLSTLLSLQYAAKGETSSEEISTRQQSLKANVNSVSAGTALMPPQVPTYIVVTCNDGDTCRLKAADNTQIKVRLVGIDAPETGKRVRKKQKEGQPGGLEAKEFLNDLVVGKTVTLRSYGADAYGRNLAEIIVNNEPANLRMVAAGWAEVYRGKPPHGFDLTPYQNAQSEALKNKKGIWGMQNYESPKDFRKRTKE